jgi:hypothetical protein
MQYHTKIKLSKRSASKLGGQHFTKIVHPSLACQEIDSATDTSRYSLSHILHIYDIAAAELILIYLRT